LLSRTKEGWALDSSCNEQIKKVSDEILLKRWLLYWSTRKELLGALAILQNNYGRIYCGATVAVETDN
jgi:hypothetical protein